MDNTGMTSPLRSFAQFAALEQKLCRLAERSPDWKGRIKAVTGPALIEFELARASRWGASLPPISRLSACVEAATSPGDSTELNQEDLLHLRHLLSDPPGEVEFRRRPGPLVAEGHVSLDPVAVPRSLDRFFEWTASKAFGEMHAIEQMALCQVRLYEIWPFEAYSWLVADFFSLRVLYLKSSILPLVAAQEAGEFDRALSQAFGFVTKPLVDLWVRACERACDQASRPV